MEFSPNSQLVTLFKGEAIAISEQSLVIYNRGAIHRLIVDPSNTYTISEFNPTKELIKKGYIVEVRNVQ